MEKDMKTITLKTVIKFMVFLCIICPDSTSQTLFRRGMFFHHSTGECIWGPNGSSTSVPQEMTSYNTQHGYSGQNAVTMTENWFPVTYDNEWSTWHNIFETNSPENISNYFAGNKIIMVKSCFPSSAIEEIGHPIDTLSPEYKTIYNYKWHWRHIITVMKNHPQNFFVIWTNAPLTESQTNPTSAMLSKIFCKWAEDTLANGLDPVFGTFPPNIYVFDFFSKLTNANGYMMLMYASGPDDPHPNAAATALVAPLLVNEVFDRSIAYEHLFGIRKSNEFVPEYYTLKQNFPNPFNPVTNIPFGIPVSGRITLSVHGISGKLISHLINGYVPAGNYIATFESKQLSSGVYFYVLEADDFTMARKMILVK
jgi:hypothetical protein